MNPLYPGIFAILLYVLGCCWQIQKLRVRASMSARRLLAVALPAVALHGISITFLFFSKEGVDLSFFTIASLIAFTATLTVLVVSFAHPLQTLYLFVFPLSVITLLGSLTFADTKVWEALPSGMAAHFLISLFAYTVLTMATFQAILMWMQERHIRNKEPIGLIRMLPPLEIMESALFRLIGMGFALLSISISSGFIVLENMLEQHVVHHTVLATTSWVVYGGLLVGHYALGWRGRTATRWTLTAFLFLMLGYFGSKFVLEFILGRG
jgi:ABC-type uncharacterized transport system permease subunit